MSTIPAAGSIAKTGVFFLLMICGHAIPSPTPPDAAALLADIRATGAKQVIARLNARPSPNAWDGVMKQIRSGQSDWLDVAAGLAQDVDAGSASDLKISLAHALVKNPDGVLELTGKQAFPDVNEVCGAPFIEPADRFLQQYLGEAKRAVAHVRNPQLKARQAACLAQLGDAEKQFRAMRRAGR